MANKNFHRKLFPFLNSPPNIPPPCTNFCDPTCTNFDDCYLLPDPDLDPPPPPTPPNNDEVFHIPAAAVIVLIVFAGVFLVVSYCAVFTRWTQRRETDPDPPESDGEVAVEMDGGDQPVDNPVWFISTVGLQQAVIDSIAMIKYRKEESLFEERRDCLVCLNEFEEGESLRILPNCNHAFHVECIDTWLRSHTSCPLCRADVSVGPTGPHLGPNDPSFGHSRWAHVAGSESVDVESGGVQTGESSGLRLTRSVSMHFCPGWSLRNLGDPSVQTNPKFGSFRMLGGSSSSSSRRVTGGNSSQVKRSYSWSERVFGSARFQKRNSDPESSS